MEGGGGDGGGGCDGGGEWKNVFDKTPSEREVLNKQRTFSQSSNVKVRRKDEKVTEKLS